MATILNSYRNIFITGNVSKTAYASVGRDGGAGSVRDGGGSKGLYSLVASILNKASSIATADKGVCLVLPDNVAIKFYSALAGVKNGEEVFSVYDKATAPHGVFGRYDTEETMTVIQQAVEAFFSCVEARKNVSIVKRSDFTQGQDGRWVYTYLKNGQSIPNTGAFISMMGNAIEKIESACPTAVEIKLEAGGDIDL